MIPFQVSLGPKLRIDISSGVMISHLWCVSLCSIIMHLSHGLNLLYKNYSSVQSETPSPTDIYTSIISTRASEENTHSTPSQLQSTSVPGGREIDCTCSECSSSAVTAVSAVSLLLIVILTTVILTQCLLMVRMRKSKDVLYRNETYAGVMTPTTMHTDVPVSPNEAYALHKMTSSSEEATYELVK